MSLRPRPFGDIGPDENSRVFTRIFDGAVVRVSRPTAPSRSRLVSTRDGACGACGCSPVRDQARLWLSVLRQRDDVYAAILLPAVLGVILADRALFAVADHGKLRVGDSDVDQIVLGRLRAPIAERQVVFGRASLIAVAFDLHFVIRILLDDVAQLDGVGAQGRNRVGTQAALVVVEIGVGNARQELIDAGAGGGIGIAREI